MAAAYVLYLILGGLIGTHCEITKVPAKTDDPISIPCPYADSFKDNVKYLCKGVMWFFCVETVKTDKPDVSGKYSISDDPQQHVFTVTINRPKEKDSGKYWCAVDKKYPDVKAPFRLSVNSGVPNLWVEQREVAAFEGGSETITCHHKQSKAIQWCRLNNTCVTENGSINGINVTIDASVPNVSNVTMSGLRTDSSGWYFFSDGNLQMPVHLTVQKSASNTTTTTVSPSTAGTLPTSSTQHSSLLTTSTEGTLPTSSTQHSSLLTTSTEADTARPTNSTADGAGGGSLQDEFKISSEVTILIAVLVTLLFLVPAAFFGWRMIKQRKTQPEESDITVGSQTGSDPDVLYTTVVHNQHAAAQNTMSQKEEESVTYSTVVLKDSVQQRPEPADGSVIYSTVKT